MTEFKLPPYLPMDLDVTLDEEDLFLEAGYQTPASITNTYLDVDFKELCNRTESTSTPFVPRSNNIKKYEFPSLMHHSDNDSGFCTENSVFSSASSLTSSTIHTPKSDFIPIKNDSESAFTLPRLTEEVLSDSRSDTDSAYDEESSICSTHSSSAFTDSLSSSPESNTMDVVFQALNLNASSGFSSENSSRYTSQENLHQNKFSEDQPMSSESESSCESQVSVVEVSSIQLEKVLPNFSRTFIDRLIGRKIGVERVDIVSELYKRSMTTCVKLIFGYLTAEELYSISTVCQTWRVAFQDDPHSRLRREDYIRTCRTPVQKENISLQGKDSSARLVRGLVDRKAEPLATIQYATPDVPTIRDAACKYQQFQQEASKLHNDESLRKCPHCDHPAKAHTVQERAICSYKQCGFDFCIKCLSQYHGSKDCSLNTQVSNKKLKTETKIGSRKSKRNLRRL